MLENILNLDGITVLDKKQLGALNGGQNCRVVLNGPGGTTTHDIDAPDGSAGSTFANDVCVGVIASDDTVNSCSYDCEYDGYGQ